MLKNKAFNCNSNFGFKLQSTNLLQQGQNQNTTNVVDFQLNSKQNKSFAFNSGSFNQNFNTEGSPNPTTSKMSYMHLRVNQTLNPQIKINVNKNVYSQNGFSQDKRYNLLQSREKILDFKANALKFLQYKIIQIKYYAESQNISTLYNKTELIHPNQTSLNFQTQPGSSINKKGKALFLNSSIIKTRSLLNRSQSPNLVDHSAILGISDKQTDKIFQLRQIAVPNYPGSKIITQANQTFTSKFHQSQGGDYFNNQQNPIIQNMASLKHYIGGRQGQSAMRYFKAREQAELEAKKHIEKLNEVMRQRQVREKKMEEILKDNSLERQFKLQKILQKRNTIREKFQKQVKDQEVRSMKLYSTSLKQLEERKNHISFLQNSTTNKSFFNNAQDSSRLSIGRHQTSIMSQRSRYRDTNEDDHHLKLQLQSIDDKLKKGLERSQIFKQQISSKASQQFQKVQSLNVRGLQEEQKSQKWSSYLMKRQTLESKLEAQRKVMNERQQYQSQKNYEKLQKTQELKKELQKSSDFRFKQQLQRFLSSEKQIKQNQEKLRLEKLKREELWHQNKIFLFQFINFIIFLSQLV